MIVTDVRKEQIHWIWSTVPCKNWILGQVHTHCEKIHLTPESLKEKLSNSRTKQLSLIKML